MVTTLRCDHFIYRIFPTKIIADANFQAISGWINRLPITAHTGNTSPSGSFLNLESPSAFVAGYFHDHVFVPWEERHAALEILSGLEADRV